MTQAPTPGPLVEDWRVGDYAARLEDHPLVKAGEVHRVTEMFRGGYLGFARPVGGEWNPSGWRKCDADGWMPWSGGENPVPGQRVEVRFKSRTLSAMEQGDFTSEQWSWKHRNVGADIIAFRLAPTAPVEASGSEREAIANLIKENVSGPFFWDDDLNAAQARDRLLAAEKIIAYLRPQPSGETREIARQTAQHILSVNFDFLVPTLEPSEQREFEDSITNAILSFLSSRPLALGGQQGEEAALVPPSGYPSYDAPIDPARSEAQDEGAAGALAAIDLIEWAIRRSDDLRDYKEALAVVLKAARAHPSPPPAADEDRVREAAETLEAIVRRATNAGGNWYGDVAAPALAVLKSEGK